MTRASAATPPEPIVRVPVLIKEGGISPRTLKRGRGFSRGEVEKAGLTVKQARLLGLYVDDRRKTVYEENVSSIVEWLKKIERGEAAPDKPKLPGVIVVKRDTRRVFKGKTMAGRKMRGLLSVKYRHTHSYKWKRKKKERRLKRRHEATRHKGGH